MMQRVGPQLNVERLLDTLWLSLEAISHSCKNKVHFSSNGSRLATQISTDHQPMALQQRLKGRL